MRNVCAICKTREAAKDRERASPKREDSPEECEEAWKKAKGCSPGSGDVRELAAAGFRDRL